jgi:hypothetical protein
MLAPRRQRVLTSGIAVAAILLCPAQALALQSGGQASGFPCIGSSDCFLSNCSTCIQENCQNAQGVCCDAPLISIHAEALIGQTCGGETTCCNGYCDDAGICAFPTGPPPLYRANDWQCRSTADCTVGICVPYPPGPPDGNYATPQRNTAGFNGNCCQSNYPRNSTPEAFDSGYCLCGEDCVSGGCGNFNDGLVCCEYGPADNPLDSADLSSGSCALYGPGCCRGFCNLDAGATKGYCDTPDHTDGFCSVLGDPCSTAAGCCSNTCYASLCCQTPGHMCRKNGDCCGNDAGWTLCVDAGSAGTQFSGTCEIVLDSGMPCKAEAECIGFGVNGPPTVGTPVCLRDSSGSGSCTLLPCYGDSDCRHSSIGPSCRGGACCGTIYDTCTSDAQCCGVDDLICGTVGSAGLMECCHPGGHPCGKSSECCGWVGGYSPTEYCTPTGNGGNGDAGTCNSCLNGGSLVAAGTPLQCCSEANKSIGAGNYKCCAPLFSSVSADAFWNNGQCRAKGDCCVAGALCPNGFCCLPEGAAPCGNNMDCCDGYCIGLPDGGGVCARLPDNGGPCTAPN